MIKKQFWSAESVVTVVAKTEAGYQIKEFNDQVFDIKTESAYRRYLKRVYENEDTQIVDIKYINFAKVTLGMSEEDFFMHAAVINNSDNALVGVTEN